MKSNRIFREELPGEKKTIINLLMTGYIVTISCLGYAAFYLYIQLGQIDRIVGTINTVTLSAEQVDLLKNRLTRSTHQLRNEMIGLAVLGSVISIIGMIYTLNMFIRPLRRLVDYAEKDGKATLPEFKSNHEIKQLATALDDLTSRLPNSPAESKNSQNPQETNY